MDKLAITIGTTVFVSEESGGLCFGCAFYDESTMRRCNEANQLQGCTPHRRKDEKHVIWVSAR